MVLDDVPHGARRVVIAGAFADALLLGDRDENRLDQGSVPYRLEKRIGESQRHHVLDRVLGEVVVDAEDLLFFESFRQLCVELLRRGQVMAERFFDHDPTGGVGLCR